jgi:hypothetical protein
MGHWDALAPFAHDETVKKNRLTRGVSLSQFAPPAANNVTNWPQNKVDARR